MFKGEIYSKLLDLLITSDLEAKFLSAGVHWGSLPHPWGACYEHGVTQWILSVVLCPSLTLEVSTVPQVCTEAQWLPKNSFMEISKIKLYTFKDMHIAHKSKSSHNQTMVPYNSSTVVILWFVSF